MTEKQFRPMLAETCDDMSALSFPVMASPKLDGIRCVILNGEPVSRKLKPIPNNHVRKVLSGLPEFDGEIMMRDAFTGKLMPFDAVQSAVMSHDGEPEIEYHVFDFHAYDGPFKDRYQQAGHLVFHEHRNLNKVPHLLEHRMIGSVQELMDFEESCVDQGYEGIMLRDPNGPYKYGRSTLREGWLLKVKRWYDAEATVIKVVERMRNENEAEVSELGLTKRSKKKAGMVPAGDMGALGLQMSKDGPKFEVGTGFTAAQRVEFWKKRKEIVGKHVTIKYQEMTKDGVPRFPVFKGFRHTDDMSA